MDTYETKILDFLKNKVAESKQPMIILENINHYVLLTMKKIEDTKIPGENKKQIIINVFKKYLHENTILEHDLKNLNTFVDQILPSTIDHFIQIDKKIIKIKKQHNFCISM